MRMLLPTCMFCVVFEIPFKFSVSATLVFHVSYYENCSSSSPPPLPWKQAPCEKERIAGSLMFLSVQKAKVHRYFASLILYILWDGRRWVGT